MTATTPTLASQYDPTVTETKWQQYWERQYSHNTYFAAEEAPLMAGTYWLTLRTNTQTFTQKIVVQ